MRYEKRQQGGTESAERVGRRLGLRRSGPRLQVV
jgi:hypothetical protein